MEGRVCFCLLAALLLAAPDSALTQETARYFADGGTLSLTPSFSQAIQRILWKLDGNLVAEWLPAGGFDYYGRFRGRTTLEPLNARLEIRNMSLAEAGLYTVEINSVAQDERFKAEQLRRVPRPEVAPQPLSCNLPSFECNLTCTGDVAEEDHVTYSWRKGNEEWEDGAKALLLDEALTGTETLFCRMKNPVSEMESPPYTNPLYREETGGSVGPVVAGVLVFILLAGAVLGLLAYKNRETLRYRFRPVQRDDNGTDAASGPGESPKTSPG